MAGLVLVRQRPGTAKGVIFATLEDETGIANIVVWSHVFERFRRTVLAARLLMVSGRLQRQGLVIHVVADDDDRSVRRAQPAVGGWPQAHARAWRAPTASSIPPRPTFSPIAIRATRW